MSEPAFIPFGKGEVIGDAPDRRVEILSDDEALAATWSRFGPRREGADLHVHRHHTDFFYVLAGELTVRLGVEDEQVVVPAGTLARVPPLVVHGFRNGTDDGLRYLNFHAPGMRFADYLRAMRDSTSFDFDQHPPPEDGIRPASEAVIGGTGFVVEQPGLRVELLADIDELGISETVSEPDGISPPTHLHRRHMESLYVLEGELTFTVDGRDVRATAGTWLQIPAGVPHTFAVTGTDFARFLDVHAPSCGYGAFLRGLHEARTENDLAAVRAAFDQEAA